MQRRNEARRGNGLAIASLMIGLIALLFAWFPMGHALAMPVAVFGVLLAVLTLFRRGSLVGLALSGGAASAFALLLPIVWAGAPAVTSGSAKDAVKNKQELEQADKAARASATDHATDGDFSVRLISATIAPTKLIAVDGSIWDNQSPSMRIELELANASATNKVEYLSWSHGYATGEHNAVSADETGREHHLWKDGLYRRVGELGSHTLMPGAKAKELLVFDPPAADAKSILLKLPKRAVNYGPGSLYLRFTAPAPFKQP